MGNTAIITTRANFNKGIGIGIYLHYNGGRDSVEGFLKYCELKHYRKPEDDCYGWLRLCQVIGNFIGGSLSAGIDVMDFTHDPCTDNGIYIIEDWKVVDRKYFTGAEQQNYELDMFLEAINDQMPKQEQIKMSFVFKNTEIPTEELTLFDYAIIFDNLKEKWVVAKVMGFGDGVINGKDVTDKPYVNLYGDNYKNNINNYILTDTVKICD